MWRPGIHVCTLPYRVRSELNFSRTAQNRLYLAVALKATWRCINRPNSMQWQDG
jgi:hypothetical protein